MQQPPHPLPPHLELELARHVEFLLGDIFGSNHVANFARLLRADSYQEAAEDNLSGMDEVASLPARNFILFRLAKIQRMSPTLCSSTFLSNALSVQWCLGRLLTRHERITRLVLSRQDI